jgi:acetolactate synthase regulatory subunit
LFRIDYDPDRVTLDRMLETIRKQGFRGEVVKDAAASTQTTGKIRRDLARLPDDLRKEVQKAKRAGKPLLLAFHSPG